MAMYKTAMTPSAHLVSVALEPELLSLAEAATEAAGRAYAPYSGFSVGAAVLLADGRTITAANVENVSYGLTICAERAAIAKAVSEGSHEISAIAIAGSGETVSPCGACRQVMAEFCDASTPIVFPYDGDLLAVRLDELLPMAFRPEGL